jgi:hypothetical protein
MRFGFVSPSASQRRRKRRWLGGKKLRRVGLKSPIRPAQDRGESRRGDFSLFGLPITVNATSRA